MDPENYDFRPLPDSDLVDTGVIVDVLQMDLLVMHLTKEPMNMVAKCGCPVFHGI